MTHPESELSFRCPRCKGSFAGADLDQLVSEILSHLEREHGHAPPREHVVSRIQRHNVT